ncbi:MAG: ABC transporter ATP-binding protein [Sedimentisphaeraceae bacterium JB056]
MAQSKYAIETIALTKAFTDWWGRTRVLAVDDLNLKVEHNEVYGLLGPNGSGKSTTLKMLLSLLKPTKGTSFILGGASDDPKIAAKIGFLPEESYLYKYLNAKETLEFYGKLFGLSSKVLKMRIESLLDMVGLSSMANRPIGTFSKGMQRRIGLAQALINDPDILILDEPTSGLDPLGTRQIKDLIKAMADRGKTVLLCSHLLADVEDVCDRICVLYGGKVQCEGKVSDLLKKGGQKQLLTDSLNDAALSEITSIIEKQGGNVKVSSPSYKLEDFFVNVVTEAQKRNQTTSGAISSRKIGDFLSTSQQPKDEDKKSQVLDKLVKVDLEAQKQATVEKVEKIKEASKPQEPKEDTSLLENLTKDEVVEENTSQVEAVEKPAEPVKKVDTDLLNELSNKKTGDGGDA